MHYSTSTATCVLSCLALLTATAGAAEGSPAELGEALYKRYCASCHGLEARGDGPVARELKIAPADLTRIAERRGGVFPSADIARFIDGRFELDSHGSREMPIWGTQLGADIADPGLGDEVVRGRIFILLEYLKSIQAG